MLGVAWMHAGDMPARVDSLRHAETLEPNRASTLCAGPALNARNQYADAQTVLSRVLDLEPENLDAAAALAEAEEAQGDAPARRSARAARSTSLQRMRRTSSWEWCGSSRSATRTPATRFDAVDPRRTPRSPKAHYQISLAYARVGTTTQQAAASNKQRIGDREGDGEGGRGQGRRKRVSGRGTLLCGVAGMVTTLAAAAPAAQPPEAAVLGAARERGLPLPTTTLPPKKYIVESMSGGVALFDFDNDGLIDIYFVDSLTVETAKIPKRRAARSIGISATAKFEDVTDKAGVGHPGWGMGVCTADVDGDGWEDLYVTALGGNKLYRNNRDGTFADITARAGVAVGGWSAGCGFADYDRDGDLDLFVSRYVKVDLDNLPQFGKDKTCEYAASRCSAARAAARRVRLLFQQRRQRTLHRRVARRPASPIRAGISAWASRGSTSTRTAGPISTSPTTRTRTSSTSIRRTARSRKSAFPMGVAVSEDGAEQGSMGVAVGDYDNTGRFSLWVTNFSEEYNALYHNDGDHFTDVSFRSKTGAVSLPYVGWGNAFFDYDNDGLLDMIVVNGHVYPQLDKARLGASAGYRQRKLLYHNRGDGTFDEVGAQAAGDHRRARQPRARRSAISTMTASSTSSSTISTAARRSCATRSPRSATG